MNSAQIFSFAYLVVCMQNYAIPRNKKHVSSFNYHKLYYDKYIDTNIVGVIHLICIIMLKTKQLFHLLCRSCICESGNVGSRFRS